MAVKATCSFTQKLGQPDFGSVGAGCEIELELDSRLLSQDPVELQAQLDVAYLVCRQAVSGQLDAFQRPLSVPERESGGSSSQRPSRPATQAQTRALWAICKDHGLSLESLCRDEFDVASADCLSIAQASHLIDKLKRTAAMAGGGQ